MNTIFVDIQESCVYHLHKGGYLEWLIGLQHDRARGKAFFRGLLININIPVKSHNRLVSRPGVEVKAAGKIIEAADVDHLSGHVEAP